jgi:hypothetical protein
MIPIRSFEIISLQPTDVVHAHLDALIEQGRPFTLCPLTYEGATGLLSHIFPNAMTHSVGA